MDMINAFDQVRPSLFVVLGKFGFDKEFIAWVQAHIRSPWTTPMINGRPSTFFKISRGLRQGFPLSPLLYITME
jgi:hypothetical protein